MLTFGGVELLFPDATGEFQHWHRQYQDIADLVQFGDSPLYELSPRRGLLAWGGDRKGVGQTVANYAAAPPPRLNSLYWPTGATRWARGYFLATGEAKERITQQAHSDGGNAPLVLRWGDESTRSPLSASMFLLPPRPISRVSAGALSEQLWLLPLVDSRYWWRERNTEDLEISSSTTWADLFSTLGSALGISVALPTAVDAAYLSPDTYEFTRRYENAAMMLDAAALSVGKRIVRRLDGTVRAESNATSEEVIAANVAKAYQLLAGGFYHDEAGYRPEKVICTFRKWRHYRVLQKGQVHTVEVEPAITTAVATSTNKVVHSTMFADYSLDSPSPPANTSDLDALAEIIGEDFYGWLRSRYDATFAGAQPWDLNGFDDSVVWDFGRQVDGSYLAQTRVQSMPVDFGFDLQLSQKNTLTLLESPMVCKPDADIAAEDSGTVSVWTGRAGEKEDSTLNVEAYAELGATAGEFTTIRWIEDDWEVDNGEAGENVIRFQLIDDLFLDTPTPNHFARAIKLNFSDIDEEWAGTGTECVVYDWYRDASSPNNDGMWNGYPGYRGMAVRRGANYTAEGWNAKYTVAVSSWFDEAGTFTLSVNGGTTGTISWDGSDVTALANDIESEILTEIGGTTGDVDVRIERDYGNAMLFYIEFTGDFELMPVTLSLGSSTHPSMVNPFITQLNGGSSSPVDLPAYDIIWMERPAQWIHFTTNEYYGETTNGQIAMTVNDYDHQGVLPNDSVVHDEDLSLIPLSSSGRWADVHEGAHGHATYNNHTRRYVITNCQRIACHAIAFLADDLCGEENPEVGITGFIHNKTGDFVGDPFEAPVTADNPHDLIGASGDTVTLRRIANGTGSFAWQIVNIDPHEQSMVVNVKIDASGNLVQERITVKVYTCDPTPAEEELIIETTVCEPEE